MVFGTGGYAPVKPLKKSEKDRIRKNCQVFNECLYAKEDNWAFCQICAKHGTYTALKEERKPRRCWKYKLLKIFCKPYITPICCVGCKWAKGGKCRR